MRGYLGTSCSHGLTIFFGACFCLLAVPSVRSAAAEVDPSVIQREQEEAQKEDEADQARGEGFSSEQTFSGRLVLGQVMEGRTDVVGLFTVEKEKTYPVKLESEALMTDLKEYNRKTVSLQGKFRNQGQYFVVTAIIPTPAPTQPVEKLGGL